MNILIKNSNLVMPNTLIKDQDYILIRAFMQGKGNNCMGTFLVTVELLVLEVIRM